jgi:hypothetical protein
VGGGGGAVVAGKILLVLKGFLPVEEQSGSNRPKESCSLGKRRGVLLKDMHDWLSW